MGIIYKVTNIENNKSYIGQTIFNLDERKKAHLRKVKAGSEFYFHRAIQKYGEDCFIWEVLEECEPDILNEREIFYIEYYNTLSHNKCGYNMTKGGDSNFGSFGECHWLFRLSDEEREDWILNHRIGENNPNYGNGNKISGDNHYTKKLPKEEVCQILEKISGDNNYQKKLTPEERKTRHWMYRKTKEEIEEFKTKCKENSINRNQDPEYRKKLMEAGNKRKGHKISARKYIITLPNGDEFLIYCFKDFCEKYKENTGVSLSKLIRCINGHIESYKNFKLRPYKEDVDYHIKEIIL